MKVSIQTRLPCNPRQVWEHIRTTRLIKYVSYPFMMFEPLNPAVFPDSWAEGTYQVKVQFLDLFPSGEHTLVISNPKCIETPGEQEYQIRDNGYGDTAKMWDHTITISEHNGETILRDDIHIDAGVMTVPVALYAKAFYAYRQARWRQLVANNFDYDAGYIPVAIEKSSLFARFIPRITDEMTRNAKNYVANSALYARWIH